MKEPAVPSRIPPFPSMPLPPHRKLVLLVVAALVVAVTDGEARTSILDHSYRNFKNTVVEVDSIFGTAARHGAVPYLVTIRNNTDKDRTWTVRLSEGSRGRTLTTETIRRFEVKSGTETTHQVLLPMAPTFAAYNYRSISVEITAPGLRNVSRGTSYQTVEQLPTIVISARLAARSMTRLNKAAEDSLSDQRFGEIFEPEFLPEDWIAYSAQDVLLIDLESWEGLTAAQRRAITEWVRMGGVLNVYKKANLSADLDVGELGFEGGVLVGKSNRTGTVRDTLRLSLGTVSLKAWDGKEVRSDLVKRLDSTKARSDLLGDDYDESWDLADQFGTREFNSALIFFLLITFAIIVAPVNLFYLAKPGKRHRLFFTTPIISVAACLIIVLLILLGDGVGGKGRRLVFADLQPHKDEMRLYLSQEQISRTGVMMNPGFETETPLAIDPAQLRQSAFSALNRETQRTAEFRYLARTYGGGFFQSRAEQGFDLRAAMPSRARIELRRPARGENPPELTSNLPTAIRAVHFRDASGTIWKSPDDVTIPPGDPIPLERADETKFGAWFARQIDPISNTKQGRIRSLREENGRFFALPVDAAPYTLDTHPSVRW
ncbi:MAG: hypothetical protein AAF368_07565, partial [Planctomycetota bacterium]